jgi:hypothetical protein
VDETYWWRQQRYLDAYYGAHGHLPWDNCPADCSGRVQAAETI